MDSKYNLLLNITVKHIQILPLFIFTLCLISNNTFYFLFQNNVIKVSICLLRTLDINFYFEQRYYKK